MLIHQSWLAACTITFLKVANGQQFDSSTSPCPARCDIESPTSWTYYYDLAELDSCDGTTIFQLNVKNAVNDPNTHVYFRACTVTGDIIGEDTNVGSRIVKRQQLSFNQTVPESSLVALSTSGSPSADAASAQSALSGLQTYLQNGVRENTILFSRAGQTIAGLFSGSQVESASAHSAVSRLGSFLSQGAQAQQTIAQACGSGNGTISPQFFGVVVDTTGDVAAVQEALRSWKDAECVTSGTSITWERVTVNIMPGSDVSVVPSTDSEPADTRLDARSSLQRRDTCRYTQVQAGDGCFSVAQRCGIPQSEMERYNRNGLCTSLKPDEYVCCSSGDLPDFSPQPGADGQCVAYTVEAGDTCFDIAEAHQMTVDDILARNTQTWGWMGCENILLGAKICLSTGTPPFPAEVSNAVCGPQAPLDDISTRPTDPDDWIDFNPCPLNACCNIWGQCGITSEFCTVSPSETGNPGTAAPGSNGCVSNCGTDIITGPGPTNFEHVGYYESSHIDRPCNFMSISDIPDKYTIVHWAFGDITDDFRASISSYENDWNDFKAATGFKRIVSFGGWAFSTERSSYYIFRQGVLPANRQTFANNMADFVQREGLDGVDFDWEYPGAPDGQGSGIPVDAPERGLDYLEFLKLVRAALPSQYTIGIAAPASFWYLKAFPIAEISQVVDYIVYMTYDLHGQWDYGNKWTSPGCPNGNCLRSHINQTETETALSMVTKAGVPANKLLLGQALYGRSFKMSSAGCYTGECTFSGPSSGAAPGRCTGVGGYLSNLEIREIIEGGQHSVQEYYTEEAGNILVYDETEWVSWATESTYDSRTDWARGLGLGGISDWAIDLDITGTRSGNGSNGGGGGENGEVVLIDPSIYSDPNPVAFCQPPCTFVFPPWQLPYTTTISPPPITSTVVNAWNDVVTRRNPDGATTTETLSFTTTTVTVITVPAVTTTAINVWNWVWTNTDQSIATLTSSLKFPPLTLTQSSTVYRISENDEETTIEGATYTFLLGPFPSVGATVSDPSVTSSTTVLPPGQSPTITTPGQTTTIPTGQPTQPPDQTTQPPPPTSCGDCPPTVTVSTGTPGPICEDGCGEPCEFGCSRPEPCSPLGLGCNCIGIGCDNGPCLGLGCVDFPGGNPPPGGFPPPPGPPPPTPPPGESPTRTTSSASSSSSSAESCPLFIEEGYTAPLDENGEPTEPNVDVPIPGGGNGGGGTTSRPVTTPRPSTTASYISCRTQNQQPGQGITRAYCVCDGSTFPQSTATDPPNSCAYTSLPGPSATISITRLPTGPTITRPTTTDPPAPTSVPNDYTFVILAREIVVGSIGGATINWSWVGITVPIGEELSSNFCNQNDFPQAVRKGVGRSSPPKFPDSLGPFDLEGRDDCTYEGDPDGPPGFITCDGGYEATCLEFTGVDVLDCAPASGNPARDNYYFALRCFYR
ncbi:unnamed protein product [Cercospora beticola]|nr:unnamed protein product [Cercospora beticola]